MTFRLFAYTFDGICVIVVAVLLQQYVIGPATARIPAVKECPRTAVSLTDLCIGAQVYAVGKWILWRWWKSRDGKQDSIYGLEHGRLHLQAPTPMWMNMGHWGDGKTRKPMAEACRDLLKAVLAEAGFSNEEERAENAKVNGRRRTLIDLGFGCGDQTIYLMSETPVRPQDREWWDAREHCVKFDHYVGITKDPLQACYANDSVDKLYAETMTSSGRDVGIISLVCADAASPASWNNQVKRRIDNALKDSPDCWMLALDTAYHFSPSRWPVIQYAHTQLRASFMAFDLCLSPSATITQKLALRVLTAFMGAPWANFSTMDEYKQKLVEVGYSADAIKIVDISEHVFTPLACYLAEQDSRLKMMGLGIGTFSVAKSLFAWWGRSSVIRGVIVVARR